MDAFLLHVMQQREAEQRLAEEGGDQHLMELHQRPPAPPPTSRKDRRALIVAAALRAQASRHGGVR